MMGRLLKSLGSAEALGVILLSMALQVLAYGISSSVPNTDTASFFWVCALAALVGYGLGRRQWRGIWASAGMGALGIVLVWILGARLTVPLLTLLKAAVGLLPQLVPSLQSGAPPDTSAVIEAWAVIAQASITLATRLQTWGMGFGANVAINDPLIRAMVWMLILWLCAAWAGWHANRRNAVASLLPSVLLLASVTSYSEYRIESLWLMVILLLMLMGIWNYRNHTWQWSRRRIDFSDSIRIDSGQAVIFLTLAIGTFAFITPSISWRDIRDTLREWRDDNQAAEMLGLQEPRGTGPGNSSQEPSLPRNHLLSGGSANSPEVVMTIRTGELPPLPAEFLPAEPSRYYWRSEVYDRYVGSGWASSHITKQTFSANTPLIPGLLRGYRLVHLDVRMAEPQGRLFWSGLLFSVDRAITPGWRVRPTSDLFADQSTLLKADVFAIPTEARAYSAEAYIPIPTVSDLREASADYPEDIRTLYLALPRSVPDRVHDLARLITDGLVNPYEKAQAIETYLRTNYPYDLEVPAPPDGRDVADFFLFDLKRGYCDYYATSMVVLARASGVPARFVSGYSPGSYDAPNAQYIVRELNAHSWAEVYFPEIGWVEFEPTASLPGIERAAERAAASTLRENEEAASALLTRFRAEQILLWSSPLLAALFAALAYFVFVERWLVLRLAPAAAIDRIQRRFYRAARPLAGTWTQAETSTEFLYKVLNAIAALEGQGRFIKLLTAIRLNATALTELYHESLFVDRVAQKADAVRAWATWKRLQRRLFVARFLYRVWNNRVSARHRSAVQS